MKQLVVLGGVLLVLGLSGCGIFQTNLTIEQAVAQLVPNDPLGVANPNRFIGELEIQESTQLWIQKKVVPGTRGQYITDEILERLILIWQQQTPVR